MPQAGMTQEELLALPTAVDIVTAGRAFGVSRTTAYRLASAGTFPVPVRHVGGSYRVSRADLLRELGVVETISA